MRYLWEKYGYTGELVYSDEQDYYIVVDQINNIDFFDILKVEQISNEYYFTFTFAFEQIDSNKDNATISFSVYRDNVYVSNKGKQIKTLYRLDFTGATIKNNEYKIQFHKELQENISGLYRLYAQDYYTGNYLKFQPAFAEDNIHTYWNDFISYVSSSNASAYPKNEIKDNYLYVYIGSDNFDVTSVWSEFPNGYKPNSVGKVYCNHNIATYNYASLGMRYSVFMDINTGSYLGDFGSDYNTSETITGTKSFPCTINKNAFSTIQFQVYAEDGVGYTQRPAIYSPVYIIQNFNGYIGINNKARKIKNMYIGINGKARKIKKIYVGVNGKARQIM